MINPRAHAPTHVVQWNGWGGPVCNVEAVVRVALDLLILLDKQESDTDLIGQA